MEKICSAALIVGSALVGVPVLGLAISVAGALWPVIPIIVGAGAAANMAANSNTNTKDDQNKNKIQ